MQWVRDICGDSPYLEAFYGRVPEVAGDISEHCGSGYISVESIVLDLVLPVIVGIVNLQETTVSIPFPGSGLHSRPVLVFPFVPLAGLRRV